MAEREAGGPFRTLDDFVGRMYGADLNKRALENLIKSGACDCFGLKRAQMLQIYEAVLDSEANRKRRNVDGQMGLFDLMDADEPIPAASTQVPDIPELSAQELMRMEKQTTGL